MMVVVNSITKHSHFINTVTTISAISSTRLYVKHIWKHHGLPREMLLDQGLQFIAEFMKELYCLLRIKLAATMAYHPQGDGQMEWVNQKLEQYLCLFINQRQDDWDELLPFAEFQYNNHVHSITCQVLFLLDTGQILQMGFEPGQHRSHLESINKFKDRMKEALDEAKAALTKSKNDMARYHNQRCSVLQHPITNLETKCTWTQVTFKLLDHPKSCLITVWVLLE